MVRIQLCGQFAVVIDGQPAESRFPGRRGRLLVAYLAAHRVQPVERNRDDRAAPRTGRDVGAEPLYPHDPHRGTWSAATG